MRIRSLHVKNFRCISECLLETPGLTTLLGENNAGKSTFLSALNFFFHSGNSVPTSDHFKNDPNNEIEIVVRFHDLTPTEKEMFAANMVTDELIVSRSFSQDPSSGLFSSWVMGNPDFAPCRDKKKSKTALRDSYKELQLTYSELKTVTNADQVEERLTEWEQANPDKLALVRLGGFRGFPSVSRSLLETKTKFISVPAITNARDMVDGKAAPITELIDTITRQTFENDKEFQEFRKRVDEEAASKTDPSKSSELQNIAGGLNAVLAELYSDSSLDLTWLPVERVEVPLPKSLVTVENFGHKGGIDKVGHGLQRAIFISALRYLAERDQSSEPSEAKFLEPQSDIIIAIEEPELYQHPLKQHLFAKTFREAVQDFSKSTGIRVQVILTTHSTSFIDLSTADDLRLIRRQTADDPSADGSTFDKVVVAACNLNECAKQTAQWLNKQPDLALYRKSLHVLKPSVCEGLFGKKVVLVEGEGDKAIMMATYAYLNRVPEREGIVVVDVGGKKKLDKPALILRELGIPAYVFMDNDETTTKKTGNAASIAQEAAYNRLIQQIQGVELANSVDWPSSVEKGFASWDNTLEGYVSTKLGTTQFDLFCKPFMDTYQIKKKDCLKNPRITTEIVTAIYEAGHKFDELEEAIGYIDALGA